ncbi:MULTISPECIES: Bbp16 family capsid cement protein [Ralstonia]|uniref:Uncharacterized protein n=1 Tax=Ralstonia condita TaxID=3058600 RepID=A0ABM9J0Z6_9RALS|nr:MULTISPECIES: hypothetical protein [Ralstonia]MBB0023633.1 hypothetical protein [Ralstonia pickettii]MBB0097008.1 hypothetical protein [Ralstonia pickettii]MBB0107022.1 hypothetical protein [Ralstonia pickettii]MBB0127781.1 hypothetical protein [Ralstonia pickettii]MBB0160722.1 hypothetical protein [Ralstonia pickettii]
MILDGNLVFDGTIATTGLTGVNQFASGATTTSTNTIDLLNARDLGDGGDSMSGNLTVSFLITTAYSGGTSVNFQLQGSTDNTTWTVYSETGAIAIASLTAGTRLALKMPSVNPDAGPPPRYLRTAYVNVGANTAGAVMAYLNTPDDNRYYKPGIVISN